MRLFCQLDIRDRSFNMAPRVSVLLFFASLGLLGVNVGANLLVGRGIADMTGLASEGALVRMHSNARYQKHY
jgi:hypothetical protein